MGVGAFIGTRARGREHWSFDERVLGGGDFVQRVIDEPRRPTPTTPVELAAVMPPETASSVPDAMPTGLGVFATRSAS
jgi:hypothetical protein